METEYTWVTEAILNKKNTRGIDMPIFKIYYRPSVIKNSMVLAQTIQ